MADLAMDEESQLMHLRQGLSSEILAALVFIPEEPSTVADMTRICQRIDNRQRALKGQLTPPSPKNPTPTPAPTSYGQAPGPMDLSGARKRLILAKRLRRIREKLYIYYGGSGHFARDCLEPGKKPLSAHELALADKPTGQLQLLPPPSGKD